MTESTDYQWMEPLTRPSCRCADFQPSTISPWLELLQGGTETGILQMEERAPPLHSNWAGLIFFLGPHCPVHILISVKSSFGNKGSLSFYAGMSIRPLCWPQAPPCGPSHTLRSRLLPRWHDKGVLTLLPVLFSFFFPFTSLSYGLDDLCTSHSLSNPKCFVNTIFCLWKFCCSNLFMACILILFRSLLTSKKILSLTRTHHSSLPLPCIMYHHYYISVHI